MSAWHALHGDKRESSTHYFRWKEEQGFHIDYCFIPQAWASHVTDVPSLRSLELTGAATTVRF